jgi:hypothetical protein
VALKLFVGITDRDWYELLRQLPELDEVNFWAPGGTSFKALSPGELFLFKLHAPDHYIVGGGIFAYSNSLPCSRAYAEGGVHDVTNDMRCIKRGKGPLLCDGAAPMIGVGDEEPKGALAKARSNQHRRAEALHFGDDLAGLQAGGNLLPQSDAVRRLG